MDYQPIYIVYILWEGVIAVEEEYDDYADAVDAFDCMVCEMRGDYRGDPDGVKGTSVHLYDTALNSTIRETIID